VLKTVYIYLTDIRHQFKLCISIHDRNIKRFSWCQLTANGSERFPVSTIEGYYII